MLKLTLDTNCVIDLENSSEPRSGALRSLVDAAGLGLVDVALVASSASEKQRDGGRLDSFAKFQNRLARLGLEHLTILKPLMRFDFSYWDWCLFADGPGGDLVTLERRIHEAMFPKMPPELAQHISKGGKEKAWRNAQCDVQIAWCHIHGNRDILVTNNTRDFQRNNKMLIALGAKAICKPEEAAQIVAVISRP